MDYFVHESSYVDEGCRIGKGTKIWHFSHVMSGCTAEIDIVARVCNCLLACFNVILKFLVALVDHLEHDSSVAASYRTNESARSSLGSCSEN